MVGRQLIERARCAAPPRETRPIGVEHVVVERQVFAAPDVDRAAGCLYV
jgi:hypothetical protein